MITALVTGANKGIGLELSRQLATRGDKVIAVCRKTSPDLDKLGVEVIDGIDVTQFSAIDILQRKLEGRILDVVINNAGVLSNESWNDLDIARIRAQIEVNTIGPLLITKALFPLLKSGSKVIMITSRLGSMADNTSGGYYGYRLSKAALNMIGINLAHDLRKHGIIVALLHPGMVATEMTKGEGIPTAESAKNLLARIDELEISHTGSFLHANGSSLPW